MKFNKGQIISDLAKDKSFKTEKSEDIEEPTNDDLATEEEVAEETEAPAEPPAEP